MKFDNTDYRFFIDELITKESQVSNYTIKIVLEDSLGNQSIEYSFQFELKSTTDSSDETVEEDVIEEFQFDWDWESLDGSDATQDDQDAEKKDSIPPSVQIQRLTSFGEVYLKFSKVMKI